MEREPKSAVRLEPRLKRTAEIVRLSADDQRQIAEAILNPPQPTPALRRAAGRYRKLFGAE
jgi:uncharacterized protein (DUF1778 family)